MKALITGASSGIGRDMAVLFAKKGIDLVLVARRVERLEVIRRHFEGKVDIKVIQADLSDEKQVISLYEQTKEDNIDILVNNAGFGACEYFYSGSLDNDLKMIRTNVVAVHILTKLFLKDFVSRDSGFILNVASSAAFFPGPLMATYYSTKSYVYKMTESVWEELKSSGSHVHISVLCPGPVSTEFNRVANVNFGIPGLKSREVAEYAAACMFLGKRVIIPGILAKAAHIVSGIIPEKILMKSVYGFQKIKLSRNNNK